MKVITFKKEHKYPYFGISDESAVILFTKADYGILIFADMPPGKNVSEPSWFITVSRWDERDFKPFNGNLEINGGT